jgi:hypothetical protein
MRRTTIRLDERLLADAKRLAAETGRTFTDLTADALREVVARRRSSERRRKPSHLTTVRGKVAPGLHLDSNERVRDFLDTVDPGWHAGP